MKRRIQESAQTDGGQTSYEAASVFSCLHSEDAIWWPRAGNIKTGGQLFRPEEA